MPEIRLAGSKSSLFTLPLLELDEFVPVVKVDVANFKSAKKATHFPGPKVELSHYIDEAKRMVEIDIVVATPGKMLVTCMIEKGRGGTLDFDGVVTPKLAGPTRGVSVEALDKGRAAYGNPYQFSVEIVGNSERAFQIDLYANDDPDDIDSGELKDVHCGRIEVRSWPDVFSEFDASRLVSEIHHIKPFADAESPDEYSGNYCLHAADRGLSKLLENTVDFYAVDGMHNKLNRIGFAGKGAKDRGAFFQGKGFVHTAITFSDYHIDHALRKATKSRSDYDANLFSVVTLARGSALSKEIYKTLDGKPGFHVFYISISDDFHTLLLLIDTRRPGAESYAIYDQHGLTSSAGMLAEIEAGFARQTSWTFLNSYMNDGFDPGKYCKVTSRLWKIQRKP